jgi:hypothetical protein
MIAPGTSVFFHYNPDSKGEWLCTAHEHWRGHQSSVTQPIHCVAGEGHLTK